jgi:hypothetical protein
MLQKLQLLVVISKVQLGESTAFASTFFLILTRCRFFAFLLIFFLPFAVKIGRLLETLLGQLLDLANFFTK